MAHRTSYCVIPAGTDEAVVEALRRHYANDPNVQVIVDRRGGDRTPGRYGGNRRKPVMRRHQALPMDVEAHLEEHLPPVTASLADLPLEHVLALASDHDPAASAELRWRCYESVMTILRLRLRTSSQAESLFPDVMDAVQEQLRHRPRQADFHEWLIGVIDRMELPR